VVKYKKFIVQYITCSV